MRLPSLIVVLAATLALPAAAQAATLQVEGDEVVYRGAPGETNQVYFNDQADCDAWGTCQDVFYFAENNANVPVSIGAGCWQDYTYPEWRSFRCSRGDGSPTKVHVYAGDGNDDVQLNGSVGTVEGGPGDDFIRGGRGADVIDGGEGNDILDPDAGMDQSWTLEGGDTVRGGPGSDTIDGTPLADKLQGGPGNDELRGGPGDDRLEGGEGADLLNGEEGVDEADYSDFDDPNADGVWVSLRDGISKEHDVQADTFVGIEDARGSAGNDWFEPRTTGSTIHAGGGNDYYNDGPGKDTFYGEDGSDQYNNGGSAGDEFYGGDGNDIAFYGGTAPLSLSVDGTADDGAAGENDNMHSDVEVLYGGTADDTIRGNATSTRLIGSAGNDHIYGGAGSETIDGDYPGLPSFTGNDVIDPGKGADTVAGGPGRDQVTYASRTAAVNVTLGAGADDGEAGEGDDIAADVEDLVGGSGDDSFNATNSPNKLEGGAGADKLRGLGGDDELIGGPNDDMMRGGGGADRLDGGTGTDRALYDDRSATDGVTVTFDGVANDGSATDGAGATARDNVLANVEDADGGAGPDSFWGTSGPNRFSGGGGNDTIRGDAGDDQLLGGDGDDVIRGGAGADRVDGGNGVDRALYDERGVADGVTVTLDNVANDGSATDASGGVRDNVLTTVENVDGGAGNDSFFGSTLPNRLFGAGGDDVLRGDAGDDVLVGGDGDDVMRGSGGADRFDGGIGTDRALYDERGAADGVTVTVDGVANDGSATDGPAAARDNVLTTVENVDGGAGSDTLTGNGFANRLFGAGGNDSLNGGAAADALVGGDGVDTISGRDGVIDTVSCGTGTPDVATVDVNDTVNADCESVSKA